MAIHRTSRPFLLSPIQTGYVNDNAELEPAPAGVDVDSLERNPRPARFRDDLANFPFDVISVRIARIGSLRDPGAEGPTESVGCRVDDLAGNRGRPDLQQVHLDRRAFHHVLFGADVTATSVNPDPVSARPAWGQAL